MKLLALDTSSISCSVALLLDSTEFERHEEKPREHTRLLMPMIRSLLEEAGVTLSDLDAIVLGNGPGSFIGMRIAASVAQGLAFGAGLRIVPVSSLRAVAAQVLAECETEGVVVTQDAHMHEVYLGIYRSDDENLPVEVVPERLHGMERIAELDAGRFAAAGAGWERYPELLAANRNDIDVLTDVLYPSAKYLLKIGTTEFAAGRVVDPQSIDPAYLRQKVAAKPTDSP